MAAYEAEQRAALAWLRGEQITLHAAPEALTFGTLSWQYVITTPIGDLAWAVAIARRDYESYDRSTS